MSAGELRGILDDDGHHPSTGGGQRKNSDLFELATRRRHQQDIRYTAQAYVDVLRTYSGHRKLPPDLLAGLLGCIGHLIDSKYEGAITKRYLYALRVARRRP